jgi:ribosomal protein S18 acetylase RimI-like enzyme
MDIKKGEIEDVKQIMSIIKDAIVDMESEEIYQWDSIYPDEDVISNDIYEGNLHIYVDANIIKGFITINEHQDKEYEAVNWKYKNGTHLITHRLCVNPKYKGKGIASTLLKYAERFGRNNKYETIRLDSFIQNIHACNLYEKAGYEKVGIVSFRKGKFYCFEKFINDSAIK